MLKLFLTIALAIGLSGCVNKYKAVVEERTASRLDGHASFYVTRPEDGRYGSHVYPGSGIATAQAIAQALALHSNNVAMASKTENIASVLSKAKESKFTYVFDVAILNWEDRATEWSGIPDKISLRFSVYDVGTGERLASSVVNASTKWATFGGDHPQDLLPLPTKTFVDSLF